ncbi:hypothetical protein M885DRAFT_459370 [Pelagophyceae sp. CCMP2097]|nr:hypothetical protein M885DRAFT_459370 [Pelagophyceae sp. CCMP2097]
MRLALALWALAGCAAFQVGGRRGANLMPRAGAATEAAVEEEQVGRQHFIRDVVSRDVAERKHAGGIVTRFPPEPNGYLHLGHAKSICLNFGIAREYGGATHMRLDDTNPDKEHPEYAAAILEDVKWLVGGADARGPRPAEGCTTRGSAPWRGEVRHASDYFETIYQCAIALCRRGLAYVDEQSPDEMKRTRGTLTTPGEDSPFRNRSPDESVALLEAMRHAGPLAAARADGTYPVLRAKIDMASPNMNLRDPALYRVKLSAHPRTGDAWRIYPMYDFAHAASDALEGITHSLCTLEFEDHRPLYDWTVAALPELRDPEWVVWTSAGNDAGGFTGAAPKWLAPRQIEFSRLNVQYTLMSKRKLMKLVNTQTVDGWDDPRMPTLSAMRRRGVPPQAIVEFCERVGVSKADSNIDPVILDDCVRDALDEKSPRAFAVLRPLKLVVDNWDASFDADAALPLEAPRHPKQEDLGFRPLYFGKDLVIDATDFHDASKGAAPPGFNRLVEGGRVRLRYGYVVRCDSVERNAKGDAEVLRCTVEYDTRSGAKGAGPRAKGIIHWLNCANAEPATVRLYDRLFDAVSPQGEPEEVNAQSKTTLLEALVEGDVAEDPSRTFQFERLGYFILDAGSKGDEKAKGLVFNRVVPLRETWAAAPAEAVPAVAKPAAAAAEASSPELDAAAKLDLRVGRVVAAVPHESSDTLWCCTVDLGESAPREIGAALRARYAAAEDLVGKDVVVLANVKPRALAGFQSHGVLLCATAGGSSQLLEPPSSAVPGDRVTPVGFAASPAATPNQLNNKKLWQLAQPLLTTSGGKPCFKDLALVGPDGAPCTVPETCPDGATVA